METPKEIAGTLPKCWLRLSPGGPPCPGHGLWCLSFQLPEGGGILETTVRVCDRHRDSAFPWAEIIFSQLGMADDIRRQVEGAGKAMPKNLHDLIPLFTLGVVSVVIQ